MSKQEQIVSKEEILYNEPREVKVGKKVVKYRSPRVKDRIEAYRLATTLPGWDTMDDLQKTLETTRIMMLLSLIEPKLTFEEYLNANEMTIANILDTIANDYSKRLEQLQKHGVLRFLPEKTE